MSVRSLACLAIALIALAFGPAWIDKDSIERPRPSPLRTTGRPTSPLPAVTGAYLEAADSIRHRDFQAARVALQPLTTGSASQAAFPRLVLGLYAHYSEELNVARALLESVRSAVPQLEDWRLFVLADTLQALNDFPAAREALTTLARDHSTSPLQAAAVAQLVALAAEHEQWAAALAWIEHARSQLLPRQEDEEIERIAWKIGHQLGRRDLQEETARILLVQHPQVASELEVLELFNKTSSKLDWATVLDQDQLLARARRLLDLGDVDSALETLSHAADPTRNTSWLLLRAEGLTRTQRGREALELLGSLEPASKAEQAALAWQRANAALDASVVRRSRHNLPQADRHRMKTQARHYLLQVTELSEDRQRAIEAHRLLFSELADDGSFDDVMQTLRSLRQLEATDTTGARFLWSRGWQCYSDRNYSGAIGYWSELEALYPESSSARAARYWTARAHEALGHGERATAMYRQITSSDTVDFYSRHARARLGHQGDQPMSEPASPTEPWPEDRLLDRARLLSDLGLEELALEELEGLSESAEQRAWCATRARILARRGMRRDSIRALSCAFPALGRPFQTVVPEDALRLYYPLDYHDIISRHAKQHGLSLFTVFAMVRQESAFDASAVSWAGARGLMQLMPATGRELASRLGLTYSTARLSDPDFSIRLGTSYFRQVLDMFEGNEELALAGYNGGPYRIKRLWRQAGTKTELDRFLEGLTLEETKTYVKRIVLFQDSYQRLYPETG